MSETPRTDALTRRYEDARGNLLERANIGAEAIAALQSTEWELAAATKRTAQECVDICDSLQSANRLSPAYAFECAQAIKERFLK